MTRAAAAVQGELFGAPAGLVCAAEFVTPDEEAGLLVAADKLAFRPFEFQGWLGKRETISFGWRYDFNQSQLETAPEIPEFLLPLRARAARLAGLAPAAFEQALVIRYETGAGIGWHRDRPAFDRIFGLSLLSACVLRFRRRNPRGYERFAFDARPRSAYLLSGEIRHEWEHSIAPVDERRFSITFRSRSPDSRGP